MTPQEAAREAARSANDFYAEGDAVFDEAFDWGFDAGWQARGEARSDAEKLIDRAAELLKPEVEARGEAWVAINSVEDLPKEDGYYLWQFQGNNRSINPSTGEHLHKVQYFSSQNNAHWYTETYEAYMPIQPFNPVPTTE